MNQIDLIKKYNVRPVKHLGQNFLIDSNVMRRIVDYLDPVREETIIEIGPGLGALTRLILERGALVVGIERDPKLISALENELAGFGHQLELVREDILKFSFQKKFKEKKVRVIGNLPYYLTSPLIFKLIEDRKSIDSAILMIQREVADRLLATPGSSQYGRITVGVRFFADVERVMNVSRRSFMPSPQIESTVILLKFRPETDIKKTGIDPHFFLEVVKSGFSQRRKNILNCLDHAGLVQMKKNELSAFLAEIGIDPGKRAEELFLKDFINLCRKIQEVIALQNKRISQKHTR